MGYLPYQLVQDFFHQTYQFSPASWQPKKGSSFSAAQRHHVVRIRVEFCQSAWHSEVLVAWREWKGEVANIEIEWNWT